MDLRDRYGEWNVYKYQFPFDMPSDMMIKYHLEVVKVQRFDLAPLTRYFTVQCLN